ncbi:gas vesicle protein [Streptomyces sp. Tu 2975]|uniref:gas vesicle protein n=1 Tax=Streptomyces sp. Tu 2975 TaxID=2676871 RepID=UPI001FC92AEA|nr:gas vesicle protein [Streptomyces sp. Tu 2975]
MNDSTGTALAAAGARTTTSWDAPASTAAPYGPRTANLADILERVLDKGIVIAGDIKIDLLDIELLTIRLRLFIASVDTARKAGIDWWETDPALSSRAARDALAEENQRLRERLEALGSGEPPAAEAGVAGEPAGT